MKYKATFTTTAEVVIEIEVTGDNQQDGLVNAHDLIRLAKPEQARIVQLDLDKVINTAFERVEDGSALPPSPLQLSGRFKIQFFRDRAQQSEVLREVVLGAYDPAKNLAESVLSEDSIYGSSRVLDEFDMPVLKATCPRGGWEVEALDAEQKVLERSSWMESSQEAKKVAFAYLSRAASVRIYDYSNRQLGPVLWKEIR